MKCQMCQFNYKLRKFIYNPNPPFREEKIYYYKFYGYPVTDDTKMIIYDNINTFAMFTTLGIIKKYSEWHWETILNEVESEYIRRYAYNYELWAKLSNLLTIVE